MMPSRSKLATKRKIIDRKGTNLKSKRKQRKTTWTEEDIPYVDISGIKQAEISKHIDLDIPPHTFLSSTNTSKCVDEQDIDTENGIDKTANKKDVNDGEDEVQMPQYNSTESITESFQDEKENFDSFVVDRRPTIGEKQNDKAHAQTDGIPSIIGKSRTSTKNDVENMEKDTLIENQNAGEKLLELEVTVLNSNMSSPQSNRTRFADNGSNSIVTMSSLGVYDDNDDTYNSYEHSLHGSIENTEEAHDSLAKATPKINVQDLINGGNPIWEDVIERYKVNGIMSKKHRKAIIVAIVQYARAKKIFLDYDLQSHISSQICTIFPTENTTTYFVMIAGKPSGKLYHLFHRMRAEDSKEEKEREKPAEATLEPTESEKESMNILKNDGRDDNVYIQKWNETFDYRQKKYLKYKSFDDFIDEWPIIENPIGSFLINIDFKSIYKKKSLTSDNWNKFFSNNWSYFKKNINKKGLRFCNKVDKLKESPSKDAALSMVLHYLLPPAYGGRKWKPTYVDSQNTVLKYIKEECMDTEIKNRNDVCELRGIKWHPYMIGQGPSKRKIKHFYVVIHNTKIKTENFISAMDLCLKLFILLNIPYPPESRAVWIFVTRVFYNINVDTLMTSRILQILNDIK